MKMPLKLDMAVIGTKVTWLAELLARLYEKSVSAPMTKAPSCARYPKNGPMV